LSGIIYIPGQFKSTDLNDAYSNQTMLSFRDGVPVAIVKGGQDDNKIIYVDSSVQGLEQAEREYLVPFEPDGLSQGILQPLPQFNKSERCYIAAQTGAGKTYYTRKYLEQLLKVYPKKQIFVFSDVEKDPELDVLGKNIVRFKLDDELLEKDPIKPDKFKGSVCVFDDIDSIQNPKLLKYVQTLRDAILRRGRHEDISCIVTSHLLTNYRDTRIVLNEANTITVFCRSGSTFGVKYLLQKYCGFDKSQIDQILKIPSRWITIYKNHPMYIAHEKGIYLV